ncbi:MAG: glycosyltransferase family 4 protein [Candidatus Krumholzibacteria bacterium]|nr:glycosyltransferase family 4 protein [Candidatus Krumholzibacteria bacterium]
MRILMVQTFYYYRGGDSTYMFNLTKLLEENGHEVVPFAMHHPQNLPSPYSGHFVSEVDFPALLGESSLRAAWTVLSRSIYNGEARSRIESLIEEVKPDIAHFHNIRSHLTTSIIKPLRKRDIPIFWTLHDFGLVCPNSSFLCGDEVCERCLPNRLYEVVLHRCKKGNLPASFVAMLAAYYDRLTGVPAQIQKFITPSAFLGRKLVEGGFAPGKVTSVPNFVDLELYRPAPERDYFLYIGRLLHEKGLDLLIRAVAGLDRGRLCIVGEGPLEQRLKELAEETGTDRVEFAGYKRDGELRALIAGSQFVVLPSRCYENLPFAIMEAFACGKPVVASRVGGIPEMVEDGVNGYLFPVGDSTALAGCLKRLLDDPSLRKQMGSLGREKAGRLYSREEHYRRIAEIYGM